MASNRDLGKATVRIDADTKNLDAKLDKAEGNVKASAKKMEASAKEASKGFDAVGAKIDDSTEGVRKFSGAITGALGAVTGLVAVFGALTSAIGRALAKQLELKRAIDETRAQNQEVLAASAQQLRQVNDETEIRRRAQEEINRLAEQEATTRESLAKAEQEQEKARRAAAIGAQGRPVNVGASPEVRKLQEDIKRLEAQRDKVVRDRDRRIAELEEQRIREAEALRDKLEAERYRKLADRERAIVEERIRREKQADDERLQRQREADAQRAALQKQAIASQKQQIEALERVAEAFNANTQAIQELVGIVRGPFGAEIRFANKVLGRIEQNTTRPITLNTS